MEQTTQKPVDEKQEKEQYEKPKVEKYDGLKTVSAQFLPPGR